jgi:hypothetical protein
MKPPLSQVISRQLEGGLNTYGANGNVYVEWKWLIGPLPLPKLSLVLIPASTYRFALLTALMTLIPAARLHAIAASCSQH